MLVEVAEGGLGEGDVAVVAVGGGKVVVVAVVVFGHEVLTGQAVYAVEEGLDFALRGGGKA